MTANEAKVLARLLLGYVISTAYYN